MSGPNTTARTRHWRGRFCSYQALDALPTLATAQADALKYEEYFDDDSCARIWLTPAHTVEVEVWDPDTARRRGRWTVIDRYRPGA